MKQKFISFYFDVAEKAAKLSHAKRLNVGAVIVKDHRILSYGYNGTPAGFDNVCEIVISDQTVTKPEVIHAETNAILKVAKSTDSTADAVMFITHSPCVECAKLILQSGIKTVYYKKDYRSADGLEILKKGNIQVIQYDEEKNKQT